MTSPSPPDNLPPALPDLPPRKLYLELTSDCNLDCAMCIRHSWSGPGGAMSPETFQAVLAQARRFPTIRTLNFSGYGEPMSHPRFWDCLAAAKAGGFAVEAVTNGTLLDDDAVERLIDLQLDRLFVSLDGLDTAASTAMHSGSFPAVSAALGRLHERRRRRGADRPTTGLIFVASKRNIHELPQLRALAVALGFVSILVTNLIPHTPDLADEILYERAATASRPRANSPYNPCVDLPLLDAGPATSEVVERLRGTGTHLRTLGLDTAGAGPRCPFITQGRLAVRHDGAVAPCLPLLHSHRYFFRHRVKHVQACNFGNVNENDGGKGIGTATGTGTGIDTGTGTSTGARTDTQKTLAEIWAGREYADFRRRVREFSFSPCIDCGTCDLRDTNREDCLGDAFPRCGECLWAAGLVQCP